METTLQQARDFADGHDLDSWSSWFAQALATAGTTDPEIPYNPDLAPEGALDPRQRRLLAAAVQAWVFGGMGSWNDIWLDDAADTRTLEEITRDLYRAVLQALTAVVNTDPAQI